MRFVGSEAQNPHWRESMLKGSAGQAPKQAMVAAAAAPVKANRRAAPLAKPAAQAASQKRYSGQAFGSFLGAAP